MLSEAKYLLFIEALLECLEGCVLERFFVAPLPQNDNNIVSLPHQYRTLNRLQQTLRRRML